MANENRLIYANEAYEIARESGRHSDFARSRADLTSLEEVLEECTTVDAVEVVRCRDCRCWDKAVVNKKGFLICPASGMEIMADDFCSYGERRDNDG